MYKTHPDFETKIEGKKCILYTSVYGTVNVNQQFTVTLICIYRGCFSRFQQTLFLNEEVIED